MITKLYLVFLLAFLALQTQSTLAESGAPSGSDRKALSPRLLIDTFSGIVVVNTIESAIGDLTKTGETRREHPAPPFMSPLGLKGLFHQHFLIALTEAEVATSALPRQEKSRFHARAATTSIGLRKSFRRVSSSKGRLLTSPFVQSRFSTGYPSPQRSFTS